jgi:chemotaxis protein CheD
MGNSLAVGLGEIQISRNPQDILVAFGLGSCVGVGIFDPVMRLGGLLHAVLPTMNNKDDNPAKYADSGIKLLLEQLTNLGAVKQRMIVRMAGGANILTAPAMSAFDIGTRNVDAARETMKQLFLKVGSEEVGGQTGRTVRLYIADGRMTIRMMGGQEREF